MNRVNIFHLFKVAFGVLLDLEVIALLPVNKTHTRIRTYSNKEEGNQGRCQREAGRYRWRGKNKMKGWGSTMLLATKSLTTTLKVIAKNKKDVVEINS